MCLQVMKGSVILASDVQQVNITADIMNITCQYVCIYYKLYKK